MIRRRVRRRIWNRLTNVQRLIILVFIASTLVTFSVSLGRYVYKKVLDLYFLTQNFYFESDKLKSNEAKYSLDYWNGVDPYNIVINVNSFKNDMLKSKSDISYDISYTCPNNVICDTSKDSSMISGETNTDSFVFTMTPNAIFNDNDSVTVYVKAKSTAPYVKTLSASFTFVVGKYGLSHEISDSEGSSYLNLKVTNTLDSYKVKEAFLDYNVGDSISSTIYNALSEENKKKCASAIITVAFDPNVVKIDNTATDYLNAYDIEVKKINNYNYVKKFTFDMNSSISNEVKFYKSNKSKNYSNTDVITVTYDY